MEALIAKLESVESGESGDNEKVALMAHLWTLSRALTLLAVDCDTLANDHLLLVSLAEKTIESTRRYKLRQLNADLSRHLEDLRAIVENMKKRTNEWSADMKRNSQFESVVNNKIDFYQKKYSEYRDQIKQIEANLKAVGFVSQITDEEIEMKRRENEILRQELKRVNDRLKKYDFQPNQSALKERISQMKRELNDMN